MATGPALGSLAPNTTAPTNPVRPGAHRGHVSGPQSSRNTTVCPTFLSGVQGGLVRKGMVKVFRK